jgi:metal-sulfur cluster biosynthetic enzyme
MTGTSAQSTDGRVREAVWAALGTVVDPELDQPITDLGFVRLCEVREGNVRLRLRLPTAFCAPNFAYLMTADAYDAVAAIPEVRSLDAQLEDHHDSAQINAGVAAQAGFAAAYGAEASAELDELRQIFRRKAHIACLERACKQLLSAGWTLDTLPTARLGDVSEPERGKLLRRRADIGLPVDTESTALVDEAGKPTAAEDVSMRLRFARTVRVSIDGNAHFCRDLLATRYGGDEREGTERAATARPAGRREAS